MPAPSPDTMQAALLERAAQADDNWLRIQYRGDRSHDYVDLKVQRVHVDAIEGLTGSGGWRLVPFSAIKIVS